MTDRDPVVAEAMRKLEAPDHRPGFWDDLDRQLVLGSPDPWKSGSGDPRTMDDGDDLVLHPAVSARHPNRMRWLAAAALLMVVAAVGVLVTRPDDDGRTVLVDQPTSTTSTSSTTVTTTRPVQPPVPPPDQVVVAWLDAVATGDTGAAAELVGPRSRARVPSLEGILQESGEGFGAWADAPDRSFTEVEVSDDLTIVVVSGTWTGEGATEFRSDAFPVVRSDDGSWLLEPWAYPLEAGPLRILQPAPNSGLAADATIEVDDRGDGRYLFSIDGGEVVDNGPSPVWDPPGDMTSQTHLLVAVHLDGDTITASATTFLVEG